MPLNGVPAFNPDSLVPNPAFAGLVSAITPETLGLNANDLFPRIPFTSNGNGMGFFVKYNLGERFMALEDQDLVRRPGSAAKKLNQSRRLETFKVSQRHLDAVVPDDVARLIQTQTGGADDPHITEVQFVRGLMLLNKEKRAAQVATDPANVGQVITVSTPWTDYTNSDPLKDIQDAMMAVRSASGLVPNSLALPWDVALKLAYHPRFRVGVFAQGGVRALTEHAEITPQAVAELLKAVLQLENVYILTSLVNKDALKRTSTTNLASVWGPNAWVFYRPPEPSPNALMWGADFVDTFYTGGTDLATVFTFYLPDQETTVHRIREDSDFVVMHPELAVRLASVI